MYVKGKIACTDNFPLEHVSISMKKQKNWFVVGDLVGNQQDYILCFAQTQVYVKCMNLEFNIW